MVFDSLEKRELYYHSLLMSSQKQGELKGLSPTTQKGDKMMRELLREHKTVEQIFKTYQEALSYDDSFRDKLESRISKIDSEFSITQINDNSFPNPIREMENMPALLYYKGDISIANNKVIAMIGQTEEIARETYENAEKLAKRLLLKKYTILSGLARTCDTIAHELAIKNNMNTIAIMPCAIDECVPKQNKDLYQKIANEHLVISQFPILKANRYVITGQLVHRDLLQAGMSPEGTIIIYAHNDSGTKHCRDHTLKQGKPIYYLPENENYTWPEKVSGKYPGQVKKIK